MKRCFQIVGAIYVAFAILTAHLALVAAKATAESSANQQTTVGTPTQAVWNNQRLDHSNQETPEIDRKQFVVEIWSARWCGPCRRWKATELPSLLKLGYQVKIRDIDKETPPEEVLKVPTVRLYYKGKLLRQTVYWRAKDLDNFVKDMLSLKK